MPTARACPSCQTSLPDEAQFCLKCGLATPTDPGVPPRTGTTGVVEVDLVKKALADRYKIERVIGEGGMATVYLALDLKHHRKVAVKVMRPELAATLGADRFLREIEIAAQLNHPHILPVHDSGAADGILYYVMPYVEGETLRERIARENQLPVPEALRLSREVAEALAYAHKQGIIHRDIKPGNVLLNAGHAMVADFGIARAVGAEGEALTKTGLAVGTPQYMAPEQSSGEREVDGRADIYAVGAVLYEMISGEPPFTGPNARAIVTRSLTERPRPLTTSRTDLAPSVETVVAKALAKSPADRYATAELFAGALDQTMDMVRSGEQVRTAEVRRASPPVGSAGKAWTLFAFSSIIGLGVFYALVKRYTLPLWVLGLGALLLLIGGGVMLMTGKMERRRASGAPLPRWGGLFTWGNAATGGFMALGLWAVVATSLVLKAPQGTGAGGAIRLAVLPFTNRGGSEHDYFVAGVTDEMRGKLTKLAGFEVIARSSSDQYQASTKSPREIGSELGVDYLLTGTVTWVPGAGGVDRVQVVPELIDVKTGASRWQQSFNSEVTDVLQIQSTIASEVAGALGVALAGDEQQQLADRPTNNPAAYDLYLKGRALAGRDPVTARQAAAYFEQAVALDQDFTEAWAGLSASQSNVFVNGNRSPAAAARAKEAADRALALDPNGTLGHIALAEYYRAVSGNLTAAREHAATALRIAPNDADVLLRMATVDAAQGHLENALAGLERAQALDPRSERVALQVQRTLLFMRRYQEAIDAGEAAIALSPNDLTTRNFRIMASLGLGDLAGARRAIAATIAVIPAPAVAAQMGGFSEISWAMEEREQQLLLRLAPAAFDNDRAWWGQSLATAHWDRGERDLAHAYADSALAPSLEQLRASPDDPQANALYAVMLAYLGRGTEAVERGNRAVALAGQEGILANPYALQQSIRIHLVLGQPEAALDQLEELLRVPYYISPAWLRIDPMYRSLKGNPRFERMVASPT